MAASGGKRRFFSGLLIFLTGFSAGTIASALLAITINEIPLPFIKPPTRDHHETADPSGEPRQKVDFRAILRNGPPPDEQPDEPVTEPSPQPEAPVAPEERSRHFVYYLQIGAFRNAASADDLRGQIVLSGYPAKINPGQLANGDTLHRVWIGPYRDEEAAESIRARLALEGYPNISLLQLSE